MDITLDKSIKNVIFDFGGVLIDWNPRYLYRNYFSTEEEMEQFLQNICTLEWNSKQDAGRPVAEAMETLTRQYPEFAEPINMYYTRWDEMIGGEIKENTDWLKKIKAAGYKVYGLTNWSAETFPKVRSEYDFFNLLDGIVMSGEEHIIKPDPRIYQILLSRYGLKPSECLFIDDNQTNVDAAISQGINALRIEPLPATDKRRV